MDIIKHGKTEPKKIQFECWKCGCIFICGVNECDEHLHNYEIIYNAVCPECGTVASADG